MIIYYGKDDVMVRDSVKSDIKYLAENMRQSDINEIWASHNKLPEDALKTGFEESLKCLTVLKDNEPVCMFGIHPDNILGKSASIWLLGTDSLAKIQYRFLKHSREFIDMFLEFYPLLYNFVDARNLDSIKWLKFCGANMNGTIPYGVEQLPFHSFKFSRSNYA